MSRRAASNRDPMERFHDEWLGLARPIDGLVVAKQALLDAQVARPGDKTLLPRLREHLHLLPTGEQGVADLSAFLADILELGPDRWVAGRALPPRFSLDVPDAGQTLRPTQALVRGPAAEPVALLWDVPPGLPLDQRETTTGEWDYPPAAKLDRLLR